MWMLRALAVGLGGFVGSVARYWLSGLVQGATVSPFSWGTLAVNIAGSFLIGFFAAAGIERGLLGPAARSFLMIGFCGGFTTMSTLSYETMALWESGQWLGAAANMGGSAAACLLAVWAGAICGRLL